MELQISASSMTPIYEQIASQIRKQIQEGKLAAGSCLPSVRKVAKDCRISALTVKKAYDQLESEGLVHSVQGKGTYVCAVNPSFVEDQIRQQVESMLDQAITTAIENGMSKSDVLQIIELLMED